MSAQTAHDNTPQLVLGAMNFGTKQDEATSFDLLDRFVDAGGEWIDTANCYAFWLDPSQVGGQSEELLGRWFARRPGVRDRIKLSTKMRQQPTVPGRWPESAEGLSAPAIRSAIEHSLRRLRTDRVDLYWAHADDRTVPQEESVEAFGELVKNGLVARLGASNHAAWRVERARQIAANRGLAGYTALQLRYTYLQARPNAVVPDAGHQLANDGDLDYVRTDPELTLWAYTSQLSGAYARNDRPVPEIYRHPGTDRRLAALAEAAAETGATPNQLVLAWLLAGGVSPIIGVSTPAQLDEAMGARSVGLTSEQWSRMDAVN
ncbi:aldo/keto reductase [Cryptosporangium minutisporangium]|uniref:Aldo/keto reductase n=1 Tax=Cryptosporangium minutisporangium TaxID=113569 RepID=A0ABP6TB95_9ACTN